MSVDRAVLFADGPPWGEYRPRGLARLLLGWASPLVRSGVTRPVGRWMQALFRRSHGRVVDIERWGLRLRLVDDGNLSERRVLFTEHRFDPGERGYLEEIIRDGDVFLDVGANAGMYSAWVASLGAEGVRIHAFEPNPVLAAQCRFNFETNGEPGARVHGCALGEHVGEATLQLDASNIGKSALAGGGGISVPIRRLSDVLEDEGVGSVRCMKIDIEGHEPGVLRDLFKNAPAERWPESIIIETLHDEGGELVEMLGVRGYREAERFRMNSVYVRAGAASE